VPVFVTTASNPQEHSYACYYDDDRGTYLGDVYSVMWMEDSEKEDLMQETLFKQFSIVRKETNTSHVQVEITLKYCLFQSVILINLLLLIGIRGSEIRKNESSSFSRTWQENRCSQQ